MSGTNIIAIAIGVALIAGIAWYFWGPRKSGVRAATTSSGYQEAMILVKGGYTPDVLVVQHGKSVRFNFRCEETAACSEMVVFNDFGKSAHLPRRNRSHRVSTGEAGRVRVHLPDGHVTRQTDCRMMGVALPERVRYGFPSQG